LETALDNLTIALCISIGSGVPWLMAIHSEFSARQLIWTSAFGMVGVTLCAFALSWVDPLYAIFGLVAAGPLCSLLAIVAGQAAKRALASRLSPPPA
jgi:hypothetical protein